MSFTYFRTVNFRDTDAAGVVYFANVLSICHEAYEASLAATDVDVKLFFSVASPVAVPIIHTEADYLRPMFCGDRLRVELTPKGLTDDQFEIHYQIFVEAVPETFSGKAVTRHQGIDATTRQRQPLPLFMKQWLQRWDIPD
jgi:1,4-dihydroxy-2-naphthoyl-CoA hydrolase